MLTDFNIALLAEDPELTKLCIDLAKENFAHQADQYLLGAEALPHVTLCQFEAEPEPERLDEIWSAMEKLKPAPLDLKIHSLCIKPGNAQNQGTYWAGLSVGLTPELKALQQKVSEALTDLNIQGTTMPQTFFPHITWVRCEYRNPPCLTRMPPLTLFENSYRFSITLGRSNQYGVYKEQLYSL